MSLMFRGHFPDVGFVIPDKDNLQHRIKIRLKIISEPGQYFNQAIPGGMDTGTSIMVSTPTKIEYSRGMKFLFNDVLYSITNITPYLPDKDKNRMIKAHALTEYIIGCQ